MPFVKLYRHSAGMTRAKPRPAGPAARRARLIRRRGRSRDPEHDGTFGIAPVTAGAYRPAVARSTRQSGPRFSRGQPARTYAR